MVLFHWLSSAFRYIQLQIKTRIIFAILVPIIFPKLCLKKVSITNEEPPLINLICQKLICQKREDVML